MKDASLCLTITLIFRSTSTHMVTLPPSKISIVSCYTCGPGIFELPAACDLKSLVRSVTLFLDFCFVTFQ
jgi:hypothetical protein